MRDYGYALWVNDLLVVQTESGEVVLVRASPKQHVEVARLAALDSRTWTHLF